jgi:hypothetical protein
MEILVYLCHVDFDQYLTSKKIDAKAFSAAEPALFDLWKKEFEQMHANSFTVQKLNLINPLRRKYLLKEAAVKVVEKAPGTTIPSPAAPSSPAPAAKPGKPVIKPKFN